MARLFISCNNRDYAVALKLQTILVEKFGHVMTLPVSALPAGRWEEQLLRGVHSADAFIGLLTDNGLESRWVVGQTGMAISCEYTRKTLVLPVCLPEVVPNFVSAFHCFWLRSGRTQAILDLAEQLDAAITAHQAARPPRIFISHRHKDQQVARKLIDLIESAFETRKSDIRCTSVPGYKLAVGAQSADTLQADLNGAEIVMGLIGPDTADSDYVLFELGASWGLRKPTFPLRIEGATFKSVPEVLREKSSLSLQDITQCLQLVEDVGRSASLTRKPGSRVHAAIRRRAEQLARVARPAAIPQPAARRNAKRTPARAE